MALLLLYFPSDIISVLMKNSIYLPASKHSVFVKVVWAVQRTMVYFLIKVFCQIIRLLVRFKVDCVPRFFCFKSYWLSERPVCFAKLDAVACDCSTFLQKRITWYFNHTVKWLSIKSMPTLENFIHSLDTWKLRPTGTYIQTITNTTRIRKYCSVAFI